MILKHASTAAPGLLLQASSAPRAHGPVGRGVIVGRRVIVWLCGCGCGVLLFSTQHNKTAFRGLLKVVLFCVSETNHKPLLLTTSSP